jgi:hypothetical protein
VLLVWALNPFGRRIRINCTCTAPVCVVRKNWSGTPGITRRKHGLLVIKR